MAAPPLSGDKGTYAFTAGNGDLTTVDIDYWEGSYEREVVGRVRPFGAAATKLCLASNPTGSGVLRFALLDGTRPALPSAPGATTGTLTLSHKSGQVFAAGKAVLWRVRAAANSTTREVQRGEYNWEFGIAGASDSNSDSIS